jgi:predicted methyltransferase MtxX (methanogen marker protein 4)
MNANDKNTAIQNIAARATRSAAAFARRGIENRGCIAGFSKGAQRAMGIDYPTGATAADREIIAAALTDRGFTVRTNSEWTPRHGRETFISFTVTAPTA